jgi:hypothetical protein
MLRNGRRTLLVTGALLLLAAAAPESALAWSSIPSRVAISYTRLTPSRLRFRIDPQYFYDFQLDFQFDPAALQFAQLDYAPAYPATSPPSFALVNAGLIQDIGGQSAVFPPPAGDQDLFYLEFDELQPQAATTVSVLASANDFIRLYDTTSAQLVTVPAGSIEPASVTTPEPGGALMLAAGAAALAGFRRRRSGSFRPARRNRRRPR